ncbi:flavodoxin domain-containing protein [Caldisalinibacter kiritimatiensis]|uniref:Flavodoxin-like domain-containing protein n=1 Tax=Caldisalinibacter kiritimatiensis TaxID=1304284 RepID=R1CFS7_9FIRM|nr:flavodoxin domain-containing protein [Caldisalinibacter kiritimatiensis]EOD01165.1 hypothetical protein L21TH_0770 [Caldisalinibacter kiritimatiensis]
MKTLIIYGTKYGCTEKCAKILSEKLTEEVELYNLKEVNDIDISDYDKVIIGGSVYIGKIRKEVTKFCLRKLNELKGKKVGLFICCMADGEAAEKQLNDVFPKELMTNAIAKENFGGEFIFNKMNFFDRFIVKKVSKTDTDQSNIHIENINRFAQLMNNV